jgi:hypothetical protein
MFAQLALLLVTPVSVLFHYNIEHDFFWLGMSFTALLIALHERILLERWQINLRA